MNVWQIGSGDSGRDYHGLFLAHDLMFLGPGRYGPYEKQNYHDVIGAREFTSTKIGMVEAFVTEVQPGDVVLLRRGHCLIGIGLVPDEGYTHDETFDDVYGWDLQHTRRVIWQEGFGKETKELQDAARFFAQQRQIATFTRVRDPRVLASIENLVSQCRIRPAHQRPDPLPQPLTLEEFGKELFARGLANSAVEQVQRAIERQRRLLAWYRRYGKESHRPDEQEVVAHMILPLLLALGWSEQLLAVEWQRVDLAGFSGTPTTDANCILVCEAKRLDHGLGEVRSQAARYAKDLKLDECRKILLTQGGRFYLFRRSSDDTWPEEPSGYINVERIRTNHIAPMGADAVETLLALTPAGIHRG